MKYFSLNTLILIGLPLFLTGCYHDWDYDVTRNHDIYRMNYKYTPPAESAPATAPGAPGAPADNTTTGAGAPQEPAVPPAR